jgi:hypothetical protein
LSQPASKAYDTMADNIITAATSGRFSEMTGTMIFLLM